MESASSPVLRLRAHPLRIALVGNPNVGKSVIFGHLTGRYATVSNYPGTTVAITNPLQAHIDLLDVITDTQMHDLVAYLESLK